MKASAAAPKPISLENSTSTQVLLRGLLLFIGLLIGSSAVIMIKASTEHPVLMAAARLLVAAVVLTPLFIRDLQRSAVPYTWQQVRWSLLPAVVLSIHFITWILGARATLASNASLLVNMLPVAMPFFSWIFYRERVTRFEVIGTLFALAGVMIMAGANFNLSFQTFLGDVICLVSMLTFAMYLALGRKNSSRLSLWLYLVPLYWMAGFLCLGVSLFFVNPIKPYTTANILYMLGLGLLPTVFSHTILNYSLKFFRGQVVGVANLLQVVFAGIMGAVFFREYPTPVYYLSAAVILTGILIVLFGGKQK